MNDKTCICEAIKLCGLSYYERDMCIGKWFSTGSIFINFPWDISQSLEISLISISVIRGMLLVQSEREITEATKHHVVPKTVPHNEHLLDQAGQ